MGKIINPGLNLLTDEQYDCLRVLPLFIEQEKLGNYKIEKIETENTIVSEPLITDFNNNEIAVEAKQILSMNTANAVSCINGILNIDVLLMIKKLDTRKVIQKNVDTQIEKLRNIETE